jgi:hypothetical protein
MCQIENPISVMESSERRKMAIFDLADIIFILFFLLFTQKLSLMGRRGH